MPFAGRRLGPADAVADHRPHDVLVEGRAGEAVVGDRGGTKQHPIGDGRQALGDAAIDRRGTVPRAQPLQRAGQHDEPLAVVGRVLRGLHAQHLPQRERILARLERGARQQHLPAPAEQACRATSHPEAADRPRASRPTDWPRRRRGTPPWACACPSQPAPARPGGSPARDGRGRARRAHPAASNRRWPPRPPGFGARESTA